MGNEFYLGHVEFAVRMRDKGETKLRWKDLIKIYISWPVAQEAFGRH